MSPSVAQREVGDLGPEDRARLADAHRALREAVERYQQFLGQELIPGQDAPVHDIERMGAAQDAVQAAEDRLWELREELQGWSRPSWAPSATLVSDWFEEDDLYDSTDPAQRR